MAQDLINSDAAIELLRRKMNIEMMTAAEPVIKKALEDIEITMRRKLGAMIIATINSSFSVERYGNDLRILVKHQQD